MKQFVVIGLGRFGSSVAKTLYQTGHEVLAIDGDREVIEDIMDSVTHAVQADATDEQALRALGLRNFDVAVVGIGGDIQASILCTLIVRELGVPFIVAKAQTELHGKVLSRIGADRVVHPERDMGLRVAHNLVSPNILDYIELSPDYSIAEVAAGKGMVGKTLRQLDIRAKYGCNVMAIKRGENINISPLADDRLREQDILVVIGSNEDLRRLEEEA
ncbi:TrkA family potassium uptake protein [Kyrpidia spormannii]|uniref:Potassium uptake protein regulator of potassium conductance ATP-dependent gating channel n=3 Tax=Kyrpidia TaxID=1129704 RepID=A0A2K8N821_9BACL|nr:MULTISPECIES: TrkA family potassium uptake protein [Kyrpidia]MBE3552479.1 TrkA family potassium uptake protein [Kyrpidia tusciae]ADG06973.1 TrkA-N domain protein [Kyrpidia tusciae DSM 2912]ATY85499.1 TrkA family potassium uptake protein [Kyrpidia spormannii]MCL6574933.1 TrkA family potassium uptake protein [Kyrpidia sp.]CAB3393725.1 potassium uptake protein [Kyrpidia spormannii]